MNKHAAVNSIYARLENMDAAMILGDAASTLIPRLRNAMFRATSYIEHSIPRLFYVVLL